MTEEALEDPSIIGVDPRRDEERRYQSLSPFELKSRLLELADARGADLLMNAGRGNPNWIATTPRAAFFLLGRFGLEEAARVWDEPGIGGMPARSGIAARLDGFLARHADEQGAELLAGAFAYGIERHGFDPDTWVHELTDAVIGDQYPTPDRMLRSCEAIVHDYLVQELCAGEEPAWSIRVSLADLPDDTYRQIGQAIARVGSEYVAEDEATTGKTA